MRSDLNGLTIFVAVVETGSFVNAADKVHVTRSAVSKTVARLESRLGVTLFHRTTRTQSLTDEGAMYYEHCRRALAEINTAEALLDIGKLQVSGRLKVTMPLHLGQCCIAPILTKLVQEHPNLNLEMSFSDRNINLVEEGYDLAIRVGTLPDSSHLAVRKLTEHRMVLCASPLYLCRLDEPVSIKNLDRQITLSYMNSGQVLKWKLSNLDGSLREFEPKSRLTMSNMRAVADTAAHGNGLAWLPSWMVKDRLENGTLVEVLRESRRVIIPVNAIWPATSYLPLKVRLAIDQLIKHLPICIVNLCYSYDLASHLLDELN